MRTRPPPKPTSPSRFVFAAGKAAQVLKARRTGAPLAKLPTSKAELDKLIKREPVK